MRFSICSFIRMFEMWFLTVFGLMCSCAAIRALSLPAAISFSTSSSRSESSARIVSAASGMGGPQHPPPGRAPPREPSRVGALARLARDVHAALLQQVPQPGPEEIVVVHEQHANVGCAPPVLDLHPPAP